LQSLSDLDLNLLLTFRTFVEAGTVRAAAKRLGRTQPAISARLAQLQDTLGVELTARSGRRLTLTPIGRLVYMHAERLAREAQLLVDNVCVGQPGGVIRVGLLPTMAAFVAAPVIARMRTSHPHTRFELEMGLVSTLLASLQRGDVDAVVGVGGERLDVPTKALGYVRPVMVVPKRGVRTGAARKKLAARALAEMAFVTYGRGDDDFYGAVERFLREQGIVERVAVRVSHIQTIKALVLEGVGAAILPDYTVREPELMALAVPGLSFRQRAWVALRAPSPPVDSIQHFVEGLATELVRSSAAHR
jgi:DNA-binding transcriptional LysR family regulator